MQFRSLVGLLCGEHARKRACLQKLVKHAGRRRHRSLAHAEQRVGRQSHDTRHRATLVERGAEQFAHQSHALGVQRQRQREGVRQRLDGGRRLCAVRRQQQRQKGALLVVVLAAAAQLEVLGQLGAVAEAQQALGQHRKGKGVALKGARHAAHRQALADGVQQRVGLLRSRFRAEHAKQNAVVAQRSVQRIDCSNVTLRGRQRAGATVGSRRVGVGRRRVVIVQLGVQALAKREDGIVKRSRTLLVGHSGRQYMRRAHVIVNREIIVFNLASNESEKSTVKMMRTHMSKNGPLIRFRLNVDVQQR